MSKTILSTAFFPNTYYIALIKNGDVIIDLGEHYRKQNHRNRCEILSPNGLLKLTVPLKKRRNQTPSGKVEISYDEDWQNLHWRSLESCYRSSPYFEYYEDQLKELLFEKHQLLSELNRSTLEAIIKLLGIEEKPEYSNEFVENDNYKDLRDLSESEKADYPTYIQVFSDRHPFAADLSILDLICNEGPNAINLLPTL